MSAYATVLAELRGTCPTCARDEHGVKPEHVSLRSWHRWGHATEGAPDTEKPQCRCGTKLGNGVKFWHCGGCHETFAGERAFTRHRRGPGDARVCLDLQNGAAPGHWSDAQGTWHHGPRQERIGAPGVSGRSIARASESEQANPEEVAA